MLTDYILHLDFAFDRELLWQDYNKCREVCGSESAIAHREDFKYGRIEHILATDISEGVKLFKHINNVLGLAKFAEGQIPKYVSFSSDSYLPIHKDSMSSAWIAIVLKGQQDIYFYDDDKKEVGHTQYDCAMINGLKYHEVPIKNTKIERVLLRQYYNCTFERASELIALTL